jgi:sterol 24-C-methyltransferase
LLFTLFEGTFYAPNLAAVYSEVYRVLKPGGVFAVYEVVLTDGYENDNPEHREIRLGIEQGLGASNLVTASVAIEAIKAAGFKLEAAEDLANRSNPKDTIPWYHLIVGSVKHVTCLRDFLKAVRIRLSCRSILSRGILHYFMVAGEKIGLIPPSTHHVLKTLAQGRALHGQRWRTETLYSNVSDGRQEAAGKDTWSGCVIL